MRAWWRRRRHRCDRWRAEWIYVAGGTKGRLYCWDCNTWLTDVLPLIPLEPNPPCIPAPLMGKPTHKEDR